MSKNIIGRSVKYYDFLGDERFGTIVAIEPIINRSAESVYDNIAYIYVEDNEPEMNIHEDVVNGTLIKYAEIRPSDEVYIDE